jgi:eukaryotic-like serine/threonine-protein kinase
VLGTANYMAPEQAAGRVDEVGTPADVYALGAILYELLTGRPPFRAEAWEQTLQQVVHDEPAPPAQLQPDVPPALETICLQCLEKDLSRRYGSAGELADDLERFLEDRPVVAVPLGPLERLQRLAVREGYLIIGQVGRGPRSIVYHARLETLQQSVALKVFETGTCQRAEWEARLRRTDLGAGLVHPHLVPVQRAGWLGDAAYLAMEFVPHGTLAAKLAGERCAIREAVGLVEQLAEIVAYLHRQGVVHGNLKPSNVLLAADGIPRLADFRLSGGWYQGPLPLGAEQATGLGYLAPEYLRNAASEPRPYTDIYGLGLILYELLTGRPAVAASSAFETLERVRNEEPLPPSSCNSAVSPYLDWICMKCLRKNPWQRFARAFGLLRHLRQAKDDPTERSIPNLQRPTRGPLD